MVEAAMEGRVSVQERTSALKQMMTGRIDQEARRILQRDDMTDLVTVIKTSEDTPDIIIPKDI